MIQIHLCDHSPLVLEKCSHAILQIAKKHRISACTHLSLSCEELFFKLADTPYAADLILIDAAMENLKGIEAIRRLRSCGCRAPVIFLTLNRDLVFDAFDVAPVHYLLKDTVSPQRFEEVVLNAIGHAERHVAETILCSRGSVIKQIPLDIISYFEVRDHMVTVHYGAQSFDFYACMDYLERQLREKCFIRIHRSYLLHLDYIDLIEKNSVLLVTGEMLPLGHTYAKHVRALFSQLFPAR